MFSNQFHSISESQLQNYNIFAISKRQMNCYFCKYEENIASILSLAFSDYVMPRCPGHFRLGFWVPKIVQLIMTQAFS